jgi:hypothetical protein
MSRVLEFIKKSTAGSTNANVKKTKTMNMTAPTETGGRNFRTDRLGMPLYVSKTPLGQLHCHNAIQPR